MRYLNKDIILVPQALFWDWRHLCLTPIPSIDVHRYNLVKFKHWYLVIALAVRAYAKIRCAQSSRSLFSLDTNWAGMSKNNEFCLSFYFIHLLLLLMGDRTNKKPLIQKSQFCPKMPILNSFESRTRTQKGCPCRTHKYFWNRAHHHPSAQCNPVLSRHVSVCGLELDLLA